MCPTAGSGVAGCHTSGLDPNIVIARKQTIEENALDEPILFKPGSRFQYNNAAVDFLAALLGKAAGRPMDDYMEQHLFSKLGNKGAFWYKDRLGVPRGGGELMIRAVDLAKLGQLMLDGGKWGDKQILPAAWVKQSTSVAQPYYADYGLLWYISGDFSFVLTEMVLAAWADLGVKKHRCHDGLRDPTDAILP